MSTLFSDNFDIAGPDVDRAIWTTPTGDAAFFGRTAIRNPGSTPDGRGRVPVSDGLAHLLLSTHNPTAGTPGDSFWGSEMDSRAKFALGGSIVGLEFSARVRVPEQMPAGIVTSLFSYGLLPGLPVRHDEVDWESLSNLYQANIDPPRALTNYYVNEPLGFGHAFEVTLPSGFDVAAFHVYTFRYYQPSLEGGDGRIEWLVDNALLRVETTRVPGNALSVNLNAWAPGPEFGLAYSPELQPTPNALENVDYDYQVDWVRVASSTTPFFDNHEFAAEAKILPGVIEPTVPIYYNATLIGGGNHHAVELFDETPNASGFPSSFVDLVANTFVRDSYQKIDGSSGHYGTSFAATFSYRPASGAQELAYVPTVVRGDITTGGSAQYTSLVTGHFGSTADTSSTRTFPDPTATYTVVGVANALAVQQDLPLATGAARAVGDVFRAGTLSSMFSSEQQFDASLLLWEDKVGNVHSLQLSDASARDAHLFGTPQELGSWVELVKGAGSAWFPDSPTVRLQISNPHGLQLGIQGFLANTQNPNDDSLSVWVELLDPPNSLVQGTSYAVDFEVIALAPLTDNTNYVTPFSAKLAGTPFTKVTLDGSANINALGDTRDNVLTGNSGQNILTGGAGNDTLAGGDGTDTALFSGLWRQYTLSGNPAANAVLSGPDGNDSLSSIEILKFIDGRLTAGAWQTDATAASVARLYWGAFGRAPDTNGLINWTTIVSSGQKSLLQAAEIFLASPEFQARYPGCYPDIVHTGFADILPRCDFVDLLYRNVLGRPADPAGWANWVAKLVSGMPRANLVLAFTESPEAQNRFAFLTNNGIVTGNQLTGTAGDDLLDGHKLMHQLAGLAGNDTLIGGTGNDTLVGGDGHDSLVGAAGNDLLNGGAGNDALAGGDGTDSTLFTGLWRQYTLSGNPISNASLVGPDGNDQLTGIETLKFTDGSLTDGSWQTNAAAGSVARLYWGTLGRAPDANGLVHWTTIVSSGQKSLLQAAEIFVGSPEFQARYPNVSNGEFVDRLYQNVLGRPADPGGRANWVAQLDSGTPRATVTLAFSESAEAQNRFGFLTNNGIVTGSQLTGTDGNDLLDGHKLMHQLAGLAGNDTLMGGAGNDTLDGGPGNDLLTSGGGNNQLNGGDGTDTALFSGLWRQYTLSGNPVSNASLIGPDGNDSLIGIETLKFIDGSVSAGAWQTDDTAASIARMYWAALGRAPDANSLINWTTSVTSGQKSLLQAAETILAEPIYILPNPIRLSNPEFVDRLYQNVLGRPADPSGRAVWVGTLDSGTPRFIVAFAFTESAEAQNRFGFLTNNGIVTGNQLTGTADNDLLDGRGLIYQLSGLEGNDTLLGGAGNDTLDGGPGNDLLTGGGGNDHFVFSSALLASLNVDTLSDFTSGSDRIVLDDAIFAALPVGNLAAGSLVAAAGAVAHDVNDFILYDTNTGKLSYDPDGSGAQAAMLFATLSGQPALAAVDIWVS